MRQPSAEDLDAAQQLISSAQAGREHLGEHYREDPMSQGSGQPGSDRWSGHGHGEIPADKTSPKSQKDTTFLGHSCRLVLILNYLTVPLIRSGADFTCFLQQLRNEKYSTLASLSDGSDDL
jgi:hypothetical protein